jgi:para-nitrobenzyl esterase
VQTTHGKLTGAPDDGVLVFRGIPYGASTAGKRRFLPPQPGEPWSGVHEATEFGPICPQQGSLTDQALTDVRVIGELPDLPLSEDCLVLNVWTPGAEGGKRPVMVWLHGRGYAAGAGSETWYNGAALAKRGDVVVVTVNHRLNVYGYLHLADIGGPDFAGSGVAGILDIVLALEWVRDNIDQFGGDPGNVTIFGESGGGMKVSALLGLPGAEGLFHRAVIQSGPGIGGIRARRATEFAERLLAHLGIESNELEKLQEMPHEQLTAGLGEMAGGGPMGPGAAMRLAPVVDGAYLPRHPFHPDAAPTAAKVPLLIGSNKDEAALFLGADPRRRRLEEHELIERLKPTLGERLDEVLGVYRRTRPNDTPWELLIGISSERFRLGSILLAERKAAGGPAPVFMYLFTWEGNFLGNLLKASHAMEIPFVFDHPDIAPMTGDGPDRYELAAMMSEAWTAFARNGDPNHDGLPQWPAYDADKRATMLFNVPSRVENDPARDERLAWEGMPLR